MYSLLWYHLISYRRQALRRYSFYTSKVERVEKRPVGYCPLDVLPYGALSARTAFNGQVDSGQIFLGF